MRRTAEFDAFGPWIDEVHSPEEVPRLYRDHPLDLSTAHLTLKVPRRIARRDANPDMDLYDHLVVAGASELTVLTRRGSDYVTRVLPYQRLATVQTSVDLLAGRLVVHDVEARQPGRPAITLGYNSVSHDMVQRLARVVRAQARPEPARVPATARAPLQLGSRDLGHADVGLVTAQHELASHEPDVVPLAAHRRTRVARREGALSGPLDAFRPVTLHAAVVGAGPGELHLLHRRDWFTTGRRPEHSVSHTVVLVDRVTSAEVRESGRYAARVVAVRSGRAVVEVPFPPDAETGPAVQDVVAGASRA